MHTIATFQALVDAIIPHTPELAAIYGQNMVPGGIQGGVEQFLIWQFDHAVKLSFGLDLHPVLLSEAIARMLDSATGQLIYAGSIQRPQNSLFPGETLFCSLPRHDRLLTLSFLELLKIDLGSLPMPFQHNGSWVQIVVDLINRFTMFGYYSEWSGYGSTRLFTPEARRLEFFPFSWLQIGYPGPSLS